MVWTCTCFRGVGTWLSGNTGPFSERTTAPQPTPKTAGRDVSGSTSATASVVSEGEYGGGNIGKGSWDVYSGQVCVLSPLTAAVRLGREDVVEQLLQEGQDPNALDREGDTPLKVAVEAAAIELVEILLHYGADPLLKCPRGDISPLQLAASMKLHDIYSVLLGVAAGMHAADNRNVF